MYPETSEDGESLFQTSSSELASSLFAQSRSRRGSKVRRHRHRNRRPISKEDSKKALDSLEPEKVVVSPMSALHFKKKRDFCKTIPYMQTISETGCESKTIENAFCFGACHSYYVPAEGNTTVPYISCAYCTPRRYRWSNVWLRCPLHHSQMEDDDNSVRTEEFLASSDGESSERTIFAYRHKRIQIVSKCRCQSGTP